jgi:hypothetical protein
MVMSSAAIASPLLLDAASSMAVGKTAESDLEGFLKNI